jgi:trimeric autotransporter adhesin
MLIVIVTLQLHLHACSAASCIPKINGIISVTQHHQIYHVMKKATVLTYFLVGFASTVYSQNTNYGTGTVSIGIYNSFFGYFAGNDCTANSSHNAFFGANSGRYNTTGDQNSFFGAGSGRGNVTGNQNTGIGEDALYYNQTGGQNVAIGMRALYNNEANQNTAVGNAALTYNLSGTSNAALGFSALYLNSSGTSNTAIGASALWTNSTGSQNTAVGHEALLKNETGYYNIAVGFQSQYYNTANSNTSIGTQSLFKNSTGNSNTANGYRALYENTTGYYNVAVGSNAMNANVSGNFNMATGYFALSANTEGIRNSASGFRAMHSNTTGSNNTAAGAFALDNITIGSNNTGLGYNAGPTTADLTNTTAIGNFAVPTASNQVRIGNSAVTSIGGQVSWSTFSDGRFKKDIKEDVSGLGFIKQLRPVSYTVDKNEVDKFLHVVDSSNNQTATRGVSLRQTGFVAQEVEAVVKKTGYVFYGVDVPKNESDHYSIRYAEFVVPLVKAVQELSINAEAQQTQIEEQKKLIEQQQKQIEVLLAGLNSKIEIGTTGMNGKTKAFLLQNNPNPFTSETEIRMTLEETVGHATVIIYSLEGKEMKNIPVNDRGEVSVKISGSELSAGMYLYTLMTDGQVVDTKRMVLTQ